MNSRREVFAVLVMILFCFLSRTAIKSHIQKEWDLVVIIHFQNLDLGYLFFLIGFAIPETNSCFEVRVIFQKVISFYFISQCYCQN